MRDLPQALNTPFKTKALALLVASCLAPGFCQATSVLANQEDPRLLPAIVKVYDNHGFKMVAIDGFIHHPTADAFKQLIDLKAAGHGIVYFNSAGGDIDAAMELGRAIRASGYATQVGKLGEREDENAVLAGKCESACPIAFLGGKYRLLDTGTGRLAVHRFYTASQGRFAVDSKRLFDAERNLRLYIEEMDIHTELLDLIKRTPPDQLAIIPPQNARYWNIETGREIVSWESSSMQGVTGRMESTTGELRMEFKCVGNTVQLTSSFKPWFPVAALLNYDVHHFTVNGRRLRVEEATASHDEATGFLAVRTMLQSDMVDALTAAVSVGYALSFEGKEGEYHRPLPLHSHRSQLSNLAERCSGQ